MAKAIQSAQPTLTQQVFAAAQPNPQEQVQKIYAAAFEDATRQIQSALTASNDVVASIRAQAQELVEFADLLEVTLTAAKQSEGGEPPGDMEGAAKAEGVDEQKAKASEGTPAETTAASATPPAAETPAE